MKVLVGKFGARVPKVKISPFLTKQVNAWTPLRPFASYNV